MSTMRAGSLAGHGSCAMCVLPGWSCIRTKKQQVTTGAWNLAPGPAIEGFRSFAAVLAGFAVFWLEDICQDNPGNEWCRLHGYYGRVGGASSALHSAATKTSLVSLFLTVFVVVLMSQAA